MSKIYRIKSNGFSWCVQYRPWSWWPFWIYVKEMVGPEGPIRIKYWGNEDGPLDWIERDKKYLAEHCAKWKITHD